MVTGPLVVLPTGRKEVLACWRRGHAWSGPAELEVPGRLQPQSSDRRLGQGRGQGGARRDEAPERGSVESGLSPCRASDPAPLKPEEAPSSKVKWALSLEVLSGLGKFPCVNRSPNPGLFAQAARGPLVFRD